MPGMLCGGMVVWLTIQRIWQGVFIFLPMLLVFGLLFVFYSSRSVTVQGDRLQVEDRFSGRSEFLFDDIDGVDVQVKNKASFLVLRLKSRSSPTRITLEPFSFDEWRKLIQVLAANAPSVEIGSVAARLLRGQFYH